MTTSEQVLSALEAATKHCVGLLKAMGCHASAQELSAAWSAYKAALTAPQPVGEGDGFRQCESRNPANGERCTGHAGHGGTCHAREIPMIGASGRVTGETHEKWPIEAPHPDPPAREPKCPSWGARLLLTSGHGVYPCSCTFGPDGVNSKPREGKCGMCRGTKIVGEMCNDGDHNAMVACPCPNCCTPAKGTPCEESGSGSSVGSGVTTKAQSASMAPELSASAVPAVAAPSDPARGAEEDAKTLALYVRDLIAISMGETVRTVRRDTMMALAAKYGAEIREKL